MKNVLKKLQQARMAIIAQPIKKGARNDFAKYDYMELADFLIPAQKVFSELGLCGVVSFSAEIASLTITDLDSGEQVTITSPMSSAALKGCHEVQNLGAVQTYLRRYLWVAALEIVEHDAIDSSAPKNDGFDPKPWLDTMDAATTIDELGAAYLAAKKAAIAAGDTAIIKTLDNKGKELKAKLMAVKS